MDLGIKIGTEFLDLPPGATLDLEQENPFLQFNDDLIGSFSLPFEVLATPKNLRLLNYAAVMEKRVDNTGIDAIAFEGGVQHSRGKIKIEKPTINLNKTREGSISCYYLTGASSFWQDAKNKRMRDINMGGERTFPWENLDETGDGFWAHVIAVYNSEPGYGPSGFDYAMFQAVNFDIQALNTSGTPGGADAYAGLVLNEASDTVGGGIGLRPNEIDEIAEFGHPRARYFCPFPYLVLVLQRATELCGWKIKGDILNDATFRKITMVNTRCIDWGKIFIFGLSDHVIPHANISFDIADNLPDYSISEFLIALKNRFGWWFDFDKKSKIITIRHLKDVVGQSAVDYTRYASPVIPKTINQNTRIFALKNEFATALGDGAPNFDNISFQGGVATLADLPTAAEGNYSHCYLVRDQNNLYICAFADDDGETFEWQWYTSNIYDVLPAGYTEEIRTKATTISTKGLFPIPTALMEAYFDNPVIWFGSKLNKSEWGIHLCFYHGVHSTSFGNVKASVGNHVYAIDGNQVADWSIAFEAELIDGTKVGLYDLEWKPFLDLLKSNEKIEVTLNLPYDKYLNLSFLSQVVIRNTRMFIQKVKAVVPYNGSVTLECMRINT